MGRHPGRRNHPPAVRGRERIVWRRVARARSSPGLSYHCSVPPHGPSTSPPPLYLTAPRRLAPWPSRCPASLPQRLAAATSWDSRHRVPCSSSAWGGHPHIPCTSPWAPTGFLACLSVLCPVRAPVSVLSVHGTCPCSGPVRARACPCSGRPIELADLSRAEVPQLRPREPPPTCPCAGRDREARHLRPAPRPPRRRAQGHGRRRDEGPQRRTNSTPTPPPPPPPPSHRAVPPRAGQTDKMSEVDVLKITNEDAAFILGKGGRTSNAPPQAATSSSQAATTPFAL